MQLKSCGEVCVLDLNEVVQRVIVVLAKNNPNMTREDRQVIVDTVGVIFDDLITVNMIWTKRVAGVDSDHYLDRLGSLIKGNRKAAGGYELIEDIQNYIENLLVQVVQLPTWREINVRMRGTHVQLELGEDYRITDWMKRYGKEYRRGAVEQGW